MGWISKTPGHRCNTPRNFKAFGDRSVWECDTCKQRWMWRQLGLLWIPIRTRSIEEIQADIARAREVSAAAHEKAERLRAEREDASTESMNNMREFARKQMDAAWTIYHPDAESRKKRTRFDVLVDLAAAHEMIAAAISKRDRLRKGKP